jgi:hypothetical protein
MTVGTTGHDGRAYQLSTTALFPKRNTAEYLCFQYRARLIVGAAAQRNPLWLSVVSLDIGVCSGILPDVKLQQVDAR